MFSEWTDPYDIDNYYNDLNAAFKDISSSVSKPPSIRPTTQRPISPNVIVAPEQPTGVIVNQGPVNAQTKNNFEVKPDSIFLDNHPVGRQPEYNILRSGPPSDETPRAQENYLSDKCRQTPDYYSYLSWINVLIFIVFIFLIGMLIQTRTQLMNSNLTLRMLMMMYAHKEKNTQ